MKKILIAIACLAIYAPVSAQQKQLATTTKAAQPAAVNAGQMTFKSDTHDFGELAEGPKAEYDFEFTNTGKTPIVISNARASCGCTTPVWPKEAILPGKTGKIHVAYNTEGRVGPFTKDVFVTSNAAQAETTLHIKGTVKAKTVATTK